MALGVIAMARRVILSGRACDPRRAGDLSKACVPTFYVAGSHVHANLFYFG